MSSCHFTLILDVRAKITRSSLRACFFICQEHACTCQVILAWALLRGSTSIGVTCYKHFHIYKWSWEQVAYMGFLKDLRRVDFCTRECETADCKYQL